MPPPELSQQWESFLLEVDALATANIEFHCFGGFVITLCYGLSRSTSDIDVLSMTMKPEQHFIERCCEGSALHKKHGVYLDLVLWANAPENYAERLTEMFPGTFKRLRLMALEPYDLALAKLERNIQRDRDDVRYLARTVPLNVEVLEQRYQDELRPYLGNKEREDQTLKLWLEMIEEDRANKNGE